MGPLQPLPTTYSLALLLLVLGVGTDDHHLAMAADDLALLTHRFKRRSDFHGISPPNVSASALAPPGNAPASQVIRRKLDGYLVARQNTDIVHSEFSRNMRQHLVAVGQLHFKHTVSKRIRNLTFDFDDILF